jgi:uncharacterized protein with GYD domain
MRAIVLLDWTDQGVRNAKESVKRAQHARDAFKSLNVTMEQIYWTLGGHDIVSIIDAPDDATLAAALLKVSMFGNLRTTTLRAFDEHEFQAILDKLG